MYVSLQKIFFIAHIKRIHLKILDFLCDQCSFATISAAELRSHVKTKHQKEKRNRFQCEVCFKGFERSKSLTEHYELAHEKIKSHRCSLCHKRFAGKAGLSSHVQRRHMQQQDDNDGKKDSKSKDSDEDQDQNPESSKNYWDEKLKGMKIK